MKHKILYLFIAVAAMFSACSDDLENSTFTISEEVPAATWLEANGYSQWVGLLNYTNMFSTINLNVGDYTLFVPNNEAMSRYLSENGYASVQNIDLEYAKLLVKYHTISGNQYSQVDFGNDVLPDTTATGDRLSVTFDENGNYFVNNDAMITTFDITTTNATLFIIDKVLEPVTEYIYDRLVANTEWSLFTQLLDATGLTAVVEEPLSGRGANYTCFVVPNSAFNAAGITDLYSLADSLGAGRDTEAWKNVDNEMYRYAAYHLLSSSYSTADFVNVDDTASTETKVVVVETYAEAAFLEFQDIDGTFYINYDTESETGTQWGATTDLVCRNGVIQEVSTPLYIKAPSNVPSTKWELTDYAVLAANIPEYQLGSLTSEFTYSLSDLKEQYGDSFCYDWYTVFASSIAVCYHVGSTTDSIGTGFMNHDALSLNLGQYGYVEMETPTLVADSTTYYVGLSFYNSFGTSPSGRITIYIDGERVGSMTTIGGSAPSRFDKSDVKPDEWIAIPVVNQSKPSENEYVVGEITFPTTGRHTFRIEDNDGSQLYLDYVLFTPKK